MVSGVTFQSTVIFSSIDDHVWASWPGVDAAVNLGPHEAVAEMMREFLSQSEIGKRLADIYAAND